MRAVICKGDPTSHGGQVLEGNELITTHGRPIAQLGHMTFCPQCKGNFPIIEGLDFHTYAGIGTAVDGMHTACGAKLIATQHQMEIDDGGGASQGATGDAESKADQHAAAATGYGGSFRAVDEQTGQAIAGLPYRIVLADGRTLRGVTDKNGHTECVTGSDPATATLYWEAVASGKDQ